MLGPVDLSAYAEWLDWVIIGCESGSKRRRIDNMEITRLLAECLDAKIPVFLKQVEMDGKIVETPLWGFSSSRGIERYVQFPKVKR
jgi:protein gp37